MVRGGFGTRPYLAEPLARRGLRDGFHHRRDV